MEWLRDSGRRGRVGDSAGEGLYYVENVWEESRSVAETVAEAVACVTGQEGETGQGVYDVVDPDGLDAVFEPVSAASPRDIGNISFRLSGCSVTVYANGELIVTPHHAATDAPRDSTQSR